ncbi:MAG: hypothetical protein HON10_04060 [Euryarchaeota archaeon]|nr:hypothetical protein [Euryarchaeota archaeon]MBT7987119.1 hypothetical protein [Euryarchaeota archaeon]
MRNETSDAISDILFMNSLGFSEENIAKLKHMSVIDVKDIINSNKVSFSNKKKQNTIQDLGNQNKWKDSPPSPIEAQDIGQETWKDGEINQQEYYETMTKPSKEITRVDRSDRIGEDFDLELKLNNVDNEDVVKKINSREEWKEMMEELDGFLDDS